MKTRQKACKIIIFHLDEVFVSKTRNTTARLENQKQFMKMSETREISIRLSLNL